MMDRLKVDKALEKKVVAFIATLKRDIVAK